jgi:hypothetical protein
VAQVDLICQALAADPKLAGGVNVMGVSQVRSCHMFIAAIEQVASRSLFTFIAYLLLHAIRAASSCEATSSVATVRP